MNDVIAIIARAAEELTHFPVLKDYGVPLTRAKCARTLRARQQRLAGILHGIPREESEGLAHYCARVFDGSPQGVDRSTVLHAAAVAHCNVRRMDAEDAAERSRRNAEHDARRAAECDDLRRRATADPQEVAQLVATIEAARDAEAQDWLAAFALHHRAQEARSRLANIFDGIETARALLRTHGETVNTNVMKRPNVPDAPQAMIEFAKLLKRTR